MPIYGIATLLLLGFYQQTNATMCILITKYIVNYKNDKKMQLSVF
ncbi:hypothetical protein MuYL_3171 [Mucilaginibacter xinganensis]|uniref:Uncharacterized protein n=1 Tax=Mucilaginibacter xinganensis TaxID=1234841 RepID=A0A223NYZ4_9SPHI|nr:hypothetical protein MuYL_3171 [Mucilaginibacter xinganensis]